MRTIARPRHETSTPVLTVVRPFMRYSATRDAYVLRGVGNRFGPVLIRRTDHEHDTEPGAHFADRS